MLVRKASHLTGIVHERDIDVTWDQLMRWEAGELIQVAMPNLSADDREFIMTGITPEEWKEAFGHD